MWNARAGAGVGVGDFDEISVGWLLGGDWRGGRWSGVNRVEDAGWYGR